MDNNKNSIKKLILGSFDAESFWRDKNLSKLPTVQDKERNNIVKAMDELLFAFCEDGDELITFYKMNDAHVQYLSEIGFNFQYNRAHLNVDLNNSAIGEDCIFNALIELHEDNPIRGMFSNQIDLSPYAVLQNTENLCRKFDIPYVFANIQVVKKVNSKIYSHELNKLIDIKKAGEVVLSSEELLNIGKEYLKLQPILVKDAFGVSGKGNMYIDSVNILERIASYIGMQERHGKYTEFLIEPFLEKEMDFSCQFNIKKDGIIEVFSVQKLLNSNFAFQGTVSADSEFLSYIEKKGYFDVINKISNVLYNDGYYGDVCVDSMVLKSGEIVPIVEINARKSMGFISHFLGKRFLEKTRNGNLNFFSVGCPSIIPFEDILGLMEKEGILFKPGLKNGIIPLSANSLSINGMLDQEKSNERVYKGRLYFYCIYDTDEAKNDLCEKLERLLISLSYCIYK